MSWKLNSSMPSFHCSCPSSRSQMSPNRLAESETYATCDSCVSDSKRVSKQYFKGYNRIEALAKRFHEH